jgi:hypothetical protein
VVFRHDNGLNCVDSLLTPVEIQVGAKRGSEMANRYGEAALMAARQSSSSEVNPVARWESAMAPLYLTRPTARKKGCPRGAFPGLCEEGLIKGIPAGHSSLRLAFHSSFRSRYQWHFHIPGCPAGNKVSVAPQYPRAAPNSSQGQSWTLKDHSPRPESDSVPPSLRGTVQHQQLFVDSLHCCQLSGSRLRSRGLW